MSDPIAQPLPATDTELLNAIEDVNSGFASLRRLANGRWQVAKKDGTAVTTTSLRKSIFAALFATTQG